ncbi:protease pro-enzyme activation domain-containing protein [Massilia sp. LXY-6]|uniref:S53 family peptidase n=1 Tax=Massilia sp. LXY-6 TaxID=3379823 RepID=UPI003EE13553
MPLRKLFHDSVIEMPAQSGLLPSGLHVNAVTPEHDDELMTVSFSLSPDGHLNEELEEKVAKGEVLPVQLIRDRYGVPDAQIQPLIDWLTANHFDILYKAPDNTSVQARAIAGNVAKALEVELVRVTSDGITYTSARNAPSLPEAVAANVRAIGGLQPHRQPHKHSRRLPAGIRPKAPAKGAATRAAASTPGYLPKDILLAYHADGLGVSGEQQTIGIVIDTPPLDSDMAAFWTRCGIAVDPGRMELVNVNQSELPPPSGEETLDAQWASGIAPGAKVRIYATGSLRFSDIDAALDRILLDIANDPGLRQASMSMGLGESYMAPGEIKTEHAKFLRLAAAGVNMFVSSGDAGASPDDTGHGAGGPLQTEYEASDPCVVGVGGTSLKIAHGGRVSETAWPGSGGGKSKYFARPTWQLANGVEPGNSRLVPDVSLAADPNHGGIVILHGQEIVYGGTSWSAPAWAGFCALMNAARAAAAKPALPFLNPLLYEKQGAPCFRDITRGSNGAYDAAGGFDMVTGLGVPNIQQLIARLP